MRTRLATSAGVIACMAGAAGAGWLVVLTWHAMYSPNQGGAWAAFVGWALSLVFVLAFLLAAAVTIATDGTRRQVAARRCVMRRTFHPSNSELRRLRADRYSVGVEEHDAKVYIRLLREEGSSRCRKVGAVTERIFTGAQVEGAALAVEELRGMARQRESESLRARRAEEFERERGTAEADLRDAQLAARAIKERLEWEAREAELARQLAEQASLRQSEQVEAETLARALRSKR